MNDYGSQFEANHSLVAILQQTLSSDQNQVVKGSEKPNPRKENIPPNLNNQKPGEIQTLGNLRGEGFKGVQCNGLRED